MQREAAWLRDMVQSGRLALEYASGLTEPELEQSTFHQDAILRRLQIIGEAAKQIPQAFRDTHPEVPWQEMARFRDVVVHHYFRVDLATVWEILRNDVPAMITTIEPLIPPIGEV